jgi:hypothetical protein
MNQVYKLLTLNHLPYDNIGVAVRPDIDLEGCPGAPILI